jgi:DNA polymerase III beta subunit
MYDAMLAETVTITGHGGDEIEAYSARSLRAGPVGGVVVIHHLPGYDRQTAEFTRALAAGGYDAVMPNLYHREAPGASPDDAMAAARAQGAIPIPDERIVGEVAGAAAYLRGLSNSNGKIGVIGHCSGGRQAFLAAVSLPIDAAVDCYGGYVVGTPPGGHPLHGMPPLVERAGDLHCPLLGLFGRDDAAPSPAQVDELEQALQAHGKTYEFHSYEGAGHAFLQVDRPNYRPEAAVDAWGKIRAFFGRYLLSSRARGVVNVHLPDGEGLDQRQREGTVRLVQGDRRERVLRPPGACAGRAHAQHRLPRPGRRPLGARRGRTHRRIGAGPGQGDQRHPGLCSARPDHLERPAAACPAGPDLAVPATRPENVGASCEYLCEGGSALEMEAAGMRFVVERDALAEAVAWVARSLPSRPVLPILSGLLLAAESGGLTLSCFDYEVSARIRIDADVAEPGTVLVPGRLLAEITRSLPGHPIEVDDADDVTLTCGAASFSLVTLPLGEYPRLPELPRLAGTVDGAALATAISQVTPAASRDDTLPVITGVNVEIAGDTLTLVATDRYRLAIRELAWEPARPEVSSTLLVPAKTLADAARMMAPGVPVRILTRGAEETGSARSSRAGAGGPLRAADAMIGFESGGRRLTTRLIGGEYIKYSSKFPADFGSRGDMPAGPLAEAVRRVALVAERGSSVRLSFEPGKVTIEAGTKGQARARETVAADFTGEESAIAFSPHYLLDGLTAALVAAAGTSAAAVPEADDTSDQAKGKRDGAAPKDEGCVRLEFTSPTKPALITASPRPGEESVPDYRYLVVPLRALADA